MMWSNLMCSIHRMGKQVCINGPGHMTKMTTFNLQMSNDLKTWHEALMTGALKLV